MADTSQIAVQRFEQFLKTFRSAKNKYDFNHITFQGNYSTLQVTTTQTFIEWLSNLTSPTLKNLILGLCKSPYTDDLEQTEVDSYLESTFKANVAKDLTNKEPFGLSIAFIKSMPVISFDSHPIWRNRKINIEKTNNQSDENATVSVFNICLDSDLFSLEIDQWARDCMGSLIKDEKLLIKFLGFEKFTLAFAESFMAQFLDWKENDIDTFRYLLQLMKDVELHPFNGGLGKTENLKYRGKEASKRITHGDRLSYCIVNNTVTFLACKGHYEFH
ncbi:type II toxin-antitoxin system YoeB family toxin [Mucilaginibacter calamicampi]|uniref:type II toxin-antitoxin system YoeB family toxin n=1 Tax=Mucilaginibacter calamicampi TaxID=1302352 RepID=UPI0036710D49